MGVLGSIRVLELRAAAARDQGTDLWGEILSVLFEGAEPHGDTGSSAKVYHFNSFLLTHSYIERARLARSEMQARRDDLDHYVLHLVLRGEVFFALGTGGIRLRAMDMAILDLSCSARMGCHQAEAISLILPRNALGGADLSDVLRHGRRLLRSAPVGMVLARHLIALMEEAPRLDAQDAAILAEATLNLVLTCLGVCPSAQPDQLSPARPDPTGRVRLYIEQNLQRPGLGPDDIARDLGLSRSQLYRQFERYGGVGTYIRRRRLRRSFIEICNPREKHRRIGEIAYSLGFEDEGHFSRIFRQAFGLSPRAARAGENWPSALPGRNSSFVQWMADLPSG